MRFPKKTLIAALLALSSTVIAWAQQTGVEGAPKVELTLGYTYLHANAPPGECDCFSLNGGFGAASVALSHGWSAVTDLSAAHAGNISNTTQSVTIFNYLFGPRYTLRRSSKRFTPYGQFLIGGTHEYSNYAPVASTNAFAFSLGGSVNTRLSRHIGLNLIEVDWVHSLLPNGSNDRQNDLRVNTGIILRF